ncbi:MAG: septum formation initiator family protein [Candidatus Zixiibacteriota bacterium]
MAEEKLTKKVTRQLISRLAEYEHGFKRKTSRIVVCLGVLYLMYLFLAGDYGLLRIHRQIDERDHLKERFTQQVAEAADYKYRLTRIKTDPHYIEWLARTRYGYSRPGEIIYHLDYKSR